MDSIQSGEAPGKQISSEMTFSETGNVQTLNSPETISENIVSTEINALETQTPAPVETAVPETRKRREGLRERTPSVTGKGLTNWEDYDPIGFDRIRRNQKRRSRRRGSEPKHNRTRWQPKEDEVLKKLIEQHGKRWSHISKLMGGSRTGKQIRDRWVNKLDTSINEKVWTDAEDELLFNHWKIVGNRWSEIAKYLEGRTESSVKNRYYSHVARKIVKISEPNGEENMKLESHCSEEEAEEEEAEEIEEEGEVLKAEYTGGSEEQQSSIYPEEREMAEEEVEVPCKREEIVKQEMEDFHDHIAVEVIPKKEVDVVKFENMPDKASPEQVSSIGTLPRIQSEPRSADFDPQEQFASNQNQMYKLLAQGRGLRNPDQPYFPQKNFPPGNFPPKNYYNHPMMNYYMGMKNHPLSHQYSNFNRYPPYSNPQIMGQSPQMTQNPLMSQNPHMNPAPQMNPHMMAPYQDPSGKVMAGDPRKLSAMNFGYSNYNPYGLNYKASKKDADEYQGLLFDSRNGSNESKMSLATNYSDTYDLPSNEMRFK